jgi:hypothetical protein
MAIPMSRINLILMDPRFKYLIPIQSFEKNHWPPPRSDGPIPPLKIAAVSEVKNDGRVLVLLTSLFFCCKFLIPEHPP